MSFARSALNISTTSSNSQRISRHAIFRRTQQPTITAPGLQPKQQVKAASEYSGGTGRDVWPRSACLTAQSSPSTSPGARHLLELDRRALKPLRPAEIPQRPLGHFVSWHIPGLPVQFTGPQIVIPSALGALGQVTKDPERVGLAAAVSDLARRCRRPAGRGHPTVPHHLAPGPRRRDPGAHRRSDCGNRSAGRGRGLVRTFPVPACGRPPSEPHRLGP